MSFKIVVQKRPGNVLTKCTTKCPRVSRRSATQKLPTSVAHLSTCLPEIVAACIKWASFFAGSETGMLVGRAFGRWLLQHVSTRGQHDFVDTLLWRKVNLRLRHPHSSVGSMHESPCLGRRWKLRAETHVASRQTKLRQLVGHSTTSCFVCKRIGVTTVAVAHLDRLQTLVLSHLCDFLPWRHALYLSTWWSIESRPLLPRNIKVRTSKTVSLLGMRPVLVSTRHEKNILSKHAMIPPQEIWHVKTKNSKKKLFFRSPLRGLYLPLLIYVLFFSNIYTLFYVKNEHIPSPRKNVRGQKLVAMACARLCHSCRFVSFALHMQYENKVKVGFVAL